MKLNFPTPKPNEPSVRAAAFANKVSKTVEYLWMRWQDEKEYEDIEEYRKPLLPSAVDHDVQILKMTKRPFGFHFVADGREYQFKCAGRRIGWKRVK